MVPGLDASPRSLGAKSGRRTASAALAIYRALQHNGKVNGWFFSALRRVRMSAPKEVERGTRSWTARMGGLCSGRPRLMGNRHPVLLRCNAENALSLEATYDPPGNVWLMLLLVAVMIGGVAVAVLLGISTAMVGAAGGGTIAAVRLLVLFWRKRELTLDMSTATDTVVDQKQGRMAFLMPIENRAYWVVLEFADGFGAAADAVHKAVGPKLRTSQIVIISRAFLWLLLAIILCFVLAFGYFMLQASNAR
jgi:hypothetical protein